MVLLSSTPTLVISCIPTAQQFCTIWQLCTIWSMMNWMIKSCDYMSFGRLRQTIADYISQPSERFFLAQDGFVGYYERIKVKVLYTVYNIWVFSIWDYSIREEYHFGRARQENLWTPILTIESSTWQGFGVWPGTKINYFDQF